MDAILNRRGLLMSGAAAALAPFGEALAQPPVSTAPLFDQFFKERLQLNPQGATQLGFDKGPNAALKGRLNDQSQAGVAAQRTSIRSQLDRLRALDRAKLPEGERAGYDAIHYALD